MSIADLRSLWRRADDLGFKSIWTYDHLTGEPCFEAVTLLASMAEVTERSRIGCLVLIPGLRLLPSRAAQLATIDALSGGRLEVGIGISDDFARRDHDGLGLEFPPYEERVAAMIEMVEGLIDTTGPEGPLAAKAVQQPIAILVGGRSEVVRSLAVRLDLGWNESVTDVEAFAARAATVPDPQAQVFVRDVDSVAETVEAYRSAGATRLVLVMSPPIAIADLDELARQAEVI